MEADDSSTFQCLPVKSKLNFFQSSFIFSDLCSIMIRRRGAILLKFLKGSGGRGGGRI